jgi:hypothetical protein
MKHLLSVVGLLSYEMGQHAFRLEQRLHACLDLRRGEGRQRISTTALSAKMTTNAYGVSISHPKGCTESRSFRNAAACLAAGLTDLEFRLELHADIQLKGPRVLHRSGQRGGARRQIPEALGWL